MTTEEKAKAYEMALEAARKELGVDRKEYKVVEQVLKSIFPELRESEDEKVRKRIVLLVEQFALGLNKEPMLAYLEKQKNAFENGRQFGIMQEQARQELENSEGKERTDFTVYHPLRNGKGECECIPYSFYGSLTSFSNKEDLINFLRTCFLTKEECNEWIEQEEQKPINSFDIVPYIDDKIAALQDMWREEKVAFDWDDMHEMIEDVARHFYQKEQKPADKQDYSGLNDLERAILRGFLCADVENVPVTIIKETAKECLAQTNPAWSEEDEKILHGIEQCVYENVANIGTVNKVKYVAWLKSLRPSWKPSEEQMKALQNAVALTACDKELVRLYNQLKKL